MTELIMDKVLEEHPELKEKMTPEASFAREALRRSRERSVREIERASAVGELHARTIFLKSAGHVPAELQDEVQAVLMPAAPPIEQPEEESDGQG